MVGWAFDHTKIEDAKIVTSSDGIDFYVGNIIIQLSHNLTNMILERELLMNFETLKDMIQSISSHLFRRWHWFIGIPDGSDPILLDFPAHILKKIIVFWIGLTNVGLRINWPLQKQLYWRTRWIRTRSDNGWSGWNVHASRSGNVSANCYGIV